MQPHVIFLFSDQHNPDIMGWRGDPVVRTPHLDQLAAEGTTQNACYCASPLCVPSRCSLLSTLLPQNNGVFTNDQCLPSDRITFVHEIANAGYRTVLAGRMHFKGPDLHHGFHERLVGDIGNPSWAGKSQEAESERIYKIYGAGHAVLEEAGPGQSHVMAYDQAVIDAACGRLAEQPHNEPLFMTVGLYGPHNPYVCDPKRFAFHYKALPRLQHSQLPNETHPAIQAAMQRLGMLAPDEEAMHRARAAYYGLVETLDAHLGRLRAAAQSALGDNVIWIYASDHGDLMGDHGNFWKQSFYEGSVRVPMMWAGPGIPAGRTLTNPTSLLDLGPSLIDVSGGEELLTSDGTNLWPRINGSETEALVSERPIISQLANRGKEHIPTAMIRLGSYKLICHGIDDQRPQLFDLSKDPQELNDRGIAPTITEQELIKDLRARLYRQWDPQAAGDKAKESRHHMRRLWAFDSNHPFPSQNGWNGASTEARNPFP